MRSRVEIAFVRFVAVASVVLGGCSLLVGEDLQGLRPYPADADADVNIDAGAERGAASDAQDHEAMPATPDASAVDTGISRSDAVASDAVYDASDPQSDVQDAGAHREDAMSDDARVADRGNDAAIGDSAPEIDADAAPRDTGSTVPDAALDVPVPPGDGGIVGLGTWAVSGSGVRSTEKIEVRGWIMPSTSVRATTRSGLTIEGRLQ
jgi:hypothetical protein